MHLYSNQKHIYSVQKDQSKINRTDGICDTLLFYKDKVYNIMALKFRNSLRIKQGLKTVGGRPDFFPGVI